MKKKIIITIVCILAAWIVAGVIDFVMVRTWHKPIFCIGRELAQDGGSGTYVGLGYSFDIEGNFVSESKDLIKGVTSYRGYLFGNEVARGFREQMLP